MRVGRRQGETTRSAAAQAQRNELRGGQLVPELPSDVPSLQAEVQQAQQAIQDAMTSEDPEAYDKAAARHAAVASAFARAMRLKAC